MKMITLNPSEMLSGLLSILAFLLSVYATWKTVQFNKQTVQFNERQESLIESQKILNKRLLEKEDAESAEEKKADLGASFIKLGSGNYRLKIWNKGKCVARNISIGFPDGGDIVNKADVESKFPLELLETHQSVELSTMIHLGSKRKHAVRLGWEDDFKISNEKTVYPTI